MYKIILDHNFKGFPGPSTLVSRWEKSLYLIEGAAKKLPVSIVAWHLCHVCMKLNICKLIF